MPHAEQWWLYIINACMQQWLTRAVDKNKLQLSLRHFLSGREGGHTYCCADFFLLIALTADYFNHSIEVVINQLRIRLAGVKDQNEQVRIWEHWIDTWGHFSLSSFLRSTLDSILTQIPHDSRTPQLNQLGYLLPWPQAAITAYSQFTYTQQLDQSLVQYLREPLGDWWTPHMHRFLGGMSELPLAFEKENNIAMDQRWEIVKNYIVNTITYNSETQKVHLDGYQTHPSPFTPLFPIHGWDAVIVTTPVHILRQIMFEPAANTTTPPLPHEFYNAITDIWYGPSTKIMLQCKTRFWEKYNITGGFSRTTLPIGQLHYPTRDPINSFTEGILLVYTWKSEALLFGSLDPQAAVDETIRQITEIHPEMATEYDYVWAVEPWYNEPSAQGAYCLLKPDQFMNVRWLMYPWENVYFAGEAISFAAGWIQGALESGLRAAYQFYARNEQEADEHCLA